MSSRPTTQITIYCWSTRVDNSDRAPSRKRTAWLRRATIVRAAVPITSRSVPQTASCLTDHQPSSTPHLHRDRGAGSCLPGICLRVNQQDQQAIDDLFQHLYRTAGQAGPRDPQAEARIQQHIQPGPPGLLYHMAPVSRVSAVTDRRTSSHLAGSDQAARTSWPGQARSPSAAAAFWRPRR
jgi:hypothetical protein